jgi:hypothetical protein
VDTIWAASDPTVTATPAYTAIAAESLLDDTAPFDLAFFALADPPAKKTAKRARPDAPLPPPVASASSSSTTSDAGAPKRPRRVGPAVVDAAWLSTQPLSTHDRWPCLTQRLWQKEPRPSDARTLDADAFVTAVNDAVVDLVRSGNAKWVPTGVNRVAVVYARPAFAEDDAAVAKIHDLVWKPSEAVSVAVAPAVPPPPPASPTSSPVPIAPAPAPTPTPTPAPSTARARRHRRQTADAGAPATAPAVSTDAPSAVNEAVDDDECYGDRCEISKDLIYVKARVPSFCRATDVHAHRPTNEGPRPRQRLRRRGGGGAARSHAVAHDVARPPAGGGASVPPGGALAARPNDPVAAAGSSSTKR